MATYSFLINGLRHHDFRENLDELYECAPGRRMSMSIEHDNAEEKNAVIVYWGKKWVGYVRSGNDRRAAYSLIEGAGRGSLLGMIVDVDRKKRWLKMEVSSDSSVAMAGEDKPNVLSDWTFDGETLPVDEEEVRLHTMLCNLEMTVETQDCWDADMTEWMEYIEENLWRDISGETSEQVMRILELLTAGSNVRGEYAEAADRLQYLIDCMGSPEVRRLQAQQIIDKAHSKEMDLLLLHYADSAKDAIRQLPDELVTLFMKDGELFMGRLWYLHRPSKQVQALKTLMSMMVRLKDDKGEDASASIPKQWLLSWGTCQKDKRKAEVVQEIISTFELQRTNPELARQMAEMLDDCNCQKHADDNARRIAEVMEQQTDALKTVAGRTTIGTIVMEQNNHGLNNNLLEERKAIGG